MIKLGQGLGRVIDECVYFLTVYCRGLNFYQIYVNIIRCFQIENVSRCDVPVCRLAIQQH